MIVRPDCEMCGQPYHRYSPDDPEHKYYPVACINALRYRLDDVEGAARAVLVTADQTGALLGKPVRTWRDGDVYERLRAALGTKRPYARERARSPELERTRNET